MTLTNSGIIELNPAPLGQRAVTIVTGLGRSGTSMAAHILDASGINMGERKDAVVFEDNDFGDAIRALDSESFDAFLDIRNETHTRWGFKCTNLHEVHGWCFDYIADVRIIVMVRDIVAIACRAAAAHNLNATDMLESITAGNAHSVSWAADQDCPVLLCSYEKALADPHAFAQRIVEFAGGSAADLDKLAGLVEPERPHYVENARVM